MAAYYNEIDPFAAAWLRELIKLKVIADGVVDTRSIIDVRPNEIAGFTQCHFFAGIGVWSLALRSAGWPDDRPVWTGSEPCQPFSGAGKGLGFADERYLRPYWQHLITQCRPPVIFGEQVASKDGLAWLDVIQADLEGENYAFGAVDTCAAGFGAPHIRQRLYWVADTPGERHVGRRSGEAGDEPGEVERFERLCDADRLDGVVQPGLQGLAGNVSHGGQPGRLTTGQAGYATETSRVGGLAHDDDDGRASRRKIRPVCTEPYLEHGGATERLADSESRGRGILGNAAFPRGGGYTDCGSDTFSGLGIPTSGGCERFGDQPEYGEPDDKGSPYYPGRPGPVNGLWSLADWLRCRDDKWRPVRSGTFPLANAGAYRNRVGLLRGAGNAINLAQAQSFIEAYLTT